MPELNSTDLKRRAGRITSRLLKIYGEPVWIKTDPLDELILTILSQNTNDHNRDQAYSLLRKRFPTWENVRDAPLAKIVDAIRTAGLANQKAARIQKILNEIYNERGNLDLGFLADLPAQEVKAWLLKFKGVGNKTAAIVMQFSLGMPAFPVDTHVYRVTGRIGLRPSKMDVEQTHSHLGKVFSSKDYGHVHLNLIRLGREICHPRCPDCQHCPLRLYCDFARQVKN